MGNIHVNSPNNYFWKRNEFSSSLITLKQIKYNLDELQWQGKRSVKSEDFWLAGTGYKIKWADKSTTSYDMLDFESYTSNL